jgi:hypothetical protein
MKTAAQKYNDKLDKIFNPQIERLKKYEQTAGKILTKLNEMVDIDSCGLNKCHLINAISKILQTDTNIK